MQVVAIIVFCSTILFPLTELVALLYVLIPLRAGFVPPGFNAGAARDPVRAPVGNDRSIHARRAGHARENGSLARVIPEAALFAFGALTLMFAVVVSFDPRALWDIAERLPRRRTPPGPALDDGMRPKRGAVASSVRRRRTRRES